MFNLIDLFARHRVAANLTMGLMLLAGVWALINLKVQLNPIQPQQFVNINVVWPGASAEDMEKLVTTPIEQSLRTLPKLKTLRSSTGNTWTDISVELEHDADLTIATDQVKQRVSAVRGLPPDIEPPWIAASEQLDLIAGVIIQGANDIEEMIPLVRDMERDLLQRGVDRIEFRSFPGRELAIQVNSAQLYELGLSFPQLARMVANASQDAPGGVIGHGDLSRRIRSLDQRRDAQSFAALLLPLGDGRVVRLGDIAHVETRPIPDQPVTEVAGRPAIQMVLLRDMTSDSLLAARVLQDWLTDARAEFGDRLRIDTFIEGWTFIRDEINLILRNGLTGMTLVVLVLLLFLHFRVALWVMIGIPVTFMAALMAFYLLGGNINIVALIGIVMALGIVVDDAIVVGEDALTRFQQGNTPVDAAASGAQRMFAPVMAASLTTLCAFLPLLSMGNTPIIDVPMIMICVVIASLIECFLVLPGHLGHAFAAGSAKQNRFRRRFNDAFETFRNGTFRLLVRRAMHHRRLVVCAALALFALSLGLWTSGWIKTNLNLNIDFDEVTANVKFVSGTTKAERRGYMAELSQALQQTDHALGGDNLVMEIVGYNRARFERQTRNGPQYASIDIELVSPEQREASAAEFAARWHAAAPRSPLVEQINIKDNERNWSDFTILLRGASPDVLKQAADEVKRELAKLDGVRNLHDDLPYGQDQWIIRLTADGQAANLSIGDVGAQLRAGYDGMRVQILQQDDTEIEVKVRLPEAEQQDLASLGSFPIRTPDGDMLPLSAVARWQGQRGIEVIRHHNTERTIRINGDVDFSRITGGEVVRWFDDNLKDEILAKYGLTAGLDGASLAEREVAADFGVQFLVVLALIYVVLAWIFASYSWPLAVMLTIPLGLTGALLGHFFMGLLINPMSLLGLFTLTGIVVNDSIILVSTFKRLLEDGMPTDEAIEEAVVMRLRAVVLTSITTIAGLFPLMLEEAPIAAMFTPLAAAICFGMAYGTVLVLIVIPALLSMIISLGERRSRRRANVATSGLATAH